jgi:transposase
VDATSTGFEQLRQWACTWPRRRWAVENAKGPGRDLAQRLLGAGELVIDVPAKLSTRVRLLATGTPHKTDPADAHAVAVAAVQAGSLRSPVPEDHTTVLRLLSDRRDELVRQRTQGLNRLHVLVAALVPGRHRGKLSPATATMLLQELRPTRSADQARLLLARDLLDELTALTTRITRLDQELRSTLTATTTTLTELVGISTVLAAKILGRVRSVWRFPTAASFAAYCGTAPIEASSGDRVRHRLARTGDRQLNYALHVMAITQLRMHPPAKAYYARKRAEGKRHQEAVRCLKRRLSDVVYRQLLRDQRTAVAA